MPLKQHSELDKDYPYHNPDLSCKKRGANYIRLVDIPDDEHLNCTFSSSDAFNPFHVDVIRLFDDYDIRNSFSN